MGMLPIFHQDKEFLQEAATWEVPQAPDIPPDPPGITREEEQLQELYPSARNRNRKLNLSMTINVYLIYISLFFSGQGTTFDLNPATLP